MRVAVGLGSNIRPRRRYLLGALRSLEGLLTGLECSGVYESQAAEGIGGGRFLNMCCVGRTGLEPGTLLERLHAIEEAAGRPPPGHAGRRGPRRVDLDLLLYGDGEVRLPGLEVPHPRLTERAFVLGPLAEVAADWPVAGTGLTVGELADRVADAGMRRVTSAEELAREDSESEGGTDADGEEEEGGSENEG